MSNEKQPLRALTEIETLHRQLDLLCAIMARESRREYEMARLTANSHYIHAREIWVQRLLDDSNASALRAAAVEFGRELYRAGGEAYLDVAEDAVRIGTSPHMGNLLRQWWRGVELGVS